LHWWFFDDAQIRNIRLLTQHKLCNLSILLVSFYYEDRGVLEFVSTRRV
jgi:hypothetical protein